jgi:hypothetical protein
MAEAAVVIDNLALAGNVAASSQALAMPASNLLTPHPSERWRSLSGSDYFVLDKGAAIAADTVLVCGLTCGPNASVRLRLSSADATGAAGDILDTGPIASGTISFDVDYASFLWLMPAPAAWRFTRFEISDPDAGFVEAGCVLDGLRESFDINFANGGSIQHVDLSRVSPTASGMTLTWEAGGFRRVNLSFDWVTASQRYGVVERMDRVNGTKRNVLLMTDIASGNLARDSIFGLVTNLTPVTFGDFADIFGKQLQIDERV